MDAPPVQYVTTSDGFNIAFSIQGVGRPLVLLPNPINHIHLRWHMDLPFLGALAERFRLIQYDSRGQGMSSRGLPASHSVHDYFRDLDALVGRLGLERFVLFGRAFFADVAARYTVENPDRVDAVIIQNCRVEADRQISSYLEDLALHDWDTYVETTARTQYLLAAEPSAVVEFIRQSVTQGDWLSRVRVFKASDLTDTLRRVTSPTLVVAEVGGSMSFEDDGRRIAALVPNARLVLESPEEPRDRFVQIIDNFLREFPPVNSPPRISPAGAPLAHALSTREIEVLRLVATGKSNQQIANDLVISRNTVLRHINHIFDKIGATNRVEAASYAHRHGLV